MELVYTLIILAAIGISFVNPVISETSFAETIVEVNEDIVKKYTRDHSNNL